jgi:probable rRNA maturation factor
LGQDGDVIIISKKLPGISESVLKRFATRAAAAARLAGKINVLVTGNRELRSLNRRFRHKDAPTDVLSFPAGAGSVNDFAGDIAISADIAAANALKLGHSAIEEIKILILHGILHLAGYDHEHDQGTMRRKEAQLRRAFNLPLGLIERHGRDRKPKRKHGKKSRGT